MARSAPISAGILLFRRKEGLEVLIGHPGGPYWRNRDEGSWSIPKGLVRSDEEPLDAARREFLEETGLDVAGIPLDPLGSVRLASGKTVLAWAGEGDADLDALVSNLFTMEWPPGSGAEATFPEVDRFLWASPEVAFAKLNRAQTSFVDRLQHRIYGE